MPSVAQRPGPAAVSAVKPGRPVPASWARAAAVLLAVLTLAGCGAGAVSQTADQASGVNGYAGQVGKVLVRDATIDFSGSPSGPPAGAAYQPGGTAPLSMTLVNIGDVTDRLLSVSSPVASAGQIIGDAVLPAGSTVAVGNNSGADSRALAVRTIAIRLVGLVGPIRAGLTYPVTFRFERAGVLTANVPVGYPNGPLAQR